MREARRAIPLYAAGRIAHPRSCPASRDEWVFGCGGGHRRRRARAVGRRRSRRASRPSGWSARHREAADAAARGIPSVPKHSLRGFWRTARARVVVVTHGFGDVNRYAVSGAFVVQLWHGIPLKRIGLDSPETAAAARIRRQHVRRGAPRAALLAPCYRGAARRIRVLPAASHLVRGRLESAFALRRRARAGDRRAARGRAVARHAGAPRRAAARAAIERGRRRRSTPESRAGALRPDVARRRRRSRGALGRGMARARSTCSTRHDAVLLVRSHPLGAGELRAAVADRTGAPPRQRPRRRCHAAAARPRRARHRLLVARVRRRARAAAGRVPRAGSRGVRASARVLRHVRRRGRRATGLVPAGGSAPTSSTRSSPTTSERERRVPTGLARSASGCTPSATAATPSGCTVRFWRGSGPAPPPTSCLRRDLDDRRPLHHRRRTGTLVLTGTRDRARHRRARRSARARRAVTIAARGKTWRPCCRCARRAGADRELPLPSRRLRAA